MASELERIKSKYLRTPEAIDRLINRMKGTER